MKTHPQLGVDVLRAISDSDRVAEAVLSHHEAFDGSGYPFGLRGEAIPLSGRIVALVDVFDALTHARPYKPAWPLPDALTLIRSERGKHFDPKVVDAFFGLVGEQEALDGDASAESLARLADSLQGVAAPAYGTAREFALTPAARSGSGAPAPVQRPRVPERATL